MSKTLWFIRLLPDRGVERKHQKSLHGVLSEPVSLNQTGLFVLFQILVWLFLHHSSWSLFSPDHNQAPISSYCSAWKAISCIPADVLWDTNDLIKSHAKVPGDVGQALRQMKAAPRALQTGDAPERLGERLKAPTGFRSRFSVSCLPGAVLPSLLSLKSPSLHIIKPETGPCSYVILTN